MHTQHSNSRIIHRASVLTKQLLITLQKNLHDNITKFNVFTASSSMQKTANVAQW